MSVKKVYTLFDPCLQDASKPVAADDNTIPTLVQDMTDTMHAHDGLGIAANQIGVMKRIFIMDPSTKEEEKPLLVFINPEITWRSEETTKWGEGCLSVPGYYGEVIRPSHIKLRYEDEPRTVIEQEYDGRMADCIQHEIDHLDGIVFIEHLSALKRRMALKKIKKYIASNM